MNLEIPPSEIAAVLDPWVIGRMPRDGAAWKARVESLKRKWRRRAVRRRLLGWLPGSLRIPGWLRGRRTQAYIHDMYERAYDLAATPTTVASAARKPVLAEWRDEGLLVRRGTLPRVHLVLMARAIEALRPGTVLEVGAGDGRNLFAMAARFPDIRWQGAELTANGVAQIGRIRGLPALPENLRHYIPWPIGDETAHQRVEARVADARALPFPDRSFDLVMTHLALEQMETIRDAALSEIARVAWRHVLFVEPFADYNRTALRRAFVQTKDYFSLPVAGLRNHGIEPVFVTDAFPQNVRVGQGLVVGETSVRCQARD